MNILIGRERERESVCMCMCALKRLTQGDNPKQCLARHKAEADRIDG